MQDQFKQKMAEIWQSRNDGLLNMILLNIENFHRDVLTDEQLQKIEQVIDRFKSLEYEDSYADAFMRLCNCLEPLVMLYVFQSLRDHNDAFIEPLVTYINKNQHLDFIDKFKKRNIAFEKMQLLSSIFNDQVIEEIQACFD